MVVEVDSVEQGEDGLAAFPAAPCSEELLASHSTLEPRDTQLLGDCLGYAGRDRLRQPRQASGTLDPLPLTSVIARISKSPYFQAVKADVLFETARRYGDQGLTEKALETFGKLLEVDPDHGRAHRELAALWAGRGDYPRAAEHARRAEALGFPVDPSLRQKILEKTASPKRP
jgi:tetratricopeptide (TPR) repeat protein